MSGNGRRLLSAVSVRSRAEHGTAAALTAAPNPEELGVIRSKDIQMWDSGLFARIKPATDVVMRVDRTPAIIAVETIVQVDIAIIAAVAMQADVAPVVADALQMNS